MTESFSITVTNTNDAPVNSTMANVTIAEDTTYTFTDHTLSVSDVDGDTLTLQLAATAGTLSLSGTTDLSGSTAPGATLSFSGSSGSINTALNNMTYTPGADQNGTYTISQTVSDASTSDVDNFVITVTNVNDAPVNTLVSNVTTNEDTNYTFTGSDALSVSDADSADTLTVTLASSVGSLTLSGTTSLSFTAGDGSDDSSMVFSGTQNDINTALANLVYTPATNSSATATVTLTTHDGTTSDVDNAIINVTAINDAPVNTVSHASTAEDTNVTLSASHLSVSDIESTSVTVSLTSSNGAMSLNGVTGLNLTTGDGTTDTVLVFDGLITDINTALAGMTFIPSSQFNGNGLITIVTSDGSESDTDTVTINVTAVNDAPTISTSGLTSVNEDSAYNYTISASDIDSSSLTYSATTKPDWLT
ncbi:Ig-like domain-containing protein, partial [Algibacillus agarilyticus]|uniref:Ig-like domain-containing protein n=1 Tax=Algibacillus agarilyticus TaxID=2234133 RepID=UPI001E59E29B